MFIKRTHQTFSRRGIKLLVELVIGVIGVLGIMLAQVEMPNQQHHLLVVDANGQVISSGAANISRQIDWLEILF